MQKIFSPAIDLFSEAEKISSGGKKISVTFAEYRRTESVEPNELFRGFNELRAVTYSLGLSQVERVMNFFERGEVILGSRDQISIDLAEMLALQKFAVECMSNYPLLQKKIRAHDFKFYVTDRVHAKIYLMRADDGRCRVILASANFSANAWQNRQRENFVVMDEPDAYEHYLNVFDELKKFSGTEIDLTARPLKDDGSNLEDLPAIKNVAYFKSAVVVHELPPDSAEESEYLFAQRESAQKFREIFKEAGIHPNEHGQTLLAAEKIVRMKKIMRRTHDEELDRKKTRARSRPSCSSIMTSTA